VVCMFPIITFWEINNSQITILLSESFITLAALIWFLSIVCRDVFYKLTVQ